MNPPMDDDAELLRDYATTHSDRAFARLVERHIDLVYSAALRRVGGDPHRAAEVTQMVFIDLARKAAALARHPLLTGWLHQSTRWAAANLRRAEQRRATRERAAAAEWPTGDDAPPPVEWEELRPLLDEALDELRAADREAVLLRFFSNCSFAEVGRQLGTGENAARMRVDRALDKLHGILRRKGLAGGTVALGAAMAKHAVAAAPTGLAASVTPAATAAGAAAVAATAGGAAIFMSKVAVALVGAGVVTLAVLCLQERQTLVVARDTLANAREQHARLEQEVSRAAAQAQRLQADLAALPALAELPVPNPNEIERKRLDLIIRKGEMDSYAPLFRRLKLSAQQVDAFKTLLVERAQAIYDANKLAEEEGLQFATLAEKEAFEREAARATDLRIAGLLGAEKAQQFSDYLEPWGSFAMRPRWSPDDKEDPADWDRAKKMAELWERTGRASAEQAYAQNTVLPYPQAFIDGAKAILTDAQYRELLAEQESARVRSRMIEIERAAAYAGKLKLGKNSARDYGVPAAASPPTEIRLP
ncbi:RNA polymerase sigma factor [Oleiharenicola sp. Vm1]|uniref:RNA polymerase sigma factor n=1 Tax=Oleiharenicola sp. Vm1 TaxID=3398393 RepID=UPI0039F54899